MIVGAYGSSQTDSFTINSIRGPQSTLWVAICQVTDCHWQAQSVTEKAAMGIGWRHLHEAHPKPPASTTTTALHNQEGVTS